MTVHAFDFQSPDTVESLRVECERLRAEARRCDLERIRLRDTLHTALERLTATGDEADRVWTAGMHERWFK